MVEIVKKKYPIVKGKISKILLKTKDSNFLVEGYRFEDSQSLRHEDT
jgi:hypothetical protein